MDSDVPQAVEVIEARGFIAAGCPAETLTAHGVGRVWRLAPGGRYARPAPRVVDTTDLDADKQADMATSFAQTRQIYAPSACIVLRGATVAGQGSVITAGGGLVKESVTEFLAHNRTPDGFTKDAAGGFQPIAEAARQITRPSLLLKRPWWRNYGHWLVDSAAILALAAKMPLPPQWQIVIGRQDSAKVRTVVLDTIAALAPGVTVLEHPDDEIWRFGHLFYTLPVHVPPLFKHPEGLALLRAALLRPHLHRGAATRLLFVSRGDHKMRRLDNEAELVAIAVPRGYEVVQPETLPIDEQAALFHSAKAVVGVKGAALTNLLFCPPGCRALILSPGDFKDTFFWDIAAHAQVSYGEMFGTVLERKNEARNPFRIDPERFAGLLPG